MYGEDRIRVPHYSRPLEKCFVRIIEQHSSEEDQSVIELYAEENKGAKSGKRRAHQILINSFYFHLQLWGYLPMRFNNRRVFSHKPIDFLKIRSRTVKFQKPYENSLDAS